MMLKPDLDSVFHEDWSEDHRSGAIAIVGLPNVGKSTLINTIIGQKIAITTPKPQTTRRRQIGIFTREAVQILFIDTPGLHKPQHKLGKYMVAMAKTALRSVDIILWVVDIAHQKEHINLPLMSTLKSTTDTPIVLAFNKCDLIEDNTLLEDKCTAYQHDVGEHLLLAGIWKISAYEGTNVTAMVESFIPYLPFGPRYYPKDQVSNVDLRFIAAEVIREQVILNTHQEIPHIVATEITRFHEKENGQHEIHAVIYVEKESQKGIIIGNKGHMIKHIGTQARRQLMNLFECRVQLYLHVKVLKQWRKQDHLMQRLGYI